MKRIMSIVLAAMLVLATLCTASAAEITDYRTYRTVANEMETFCIQNSQGAVDLDILTNCFDALLTNDNHGALIPCAAKEWSSPDEGQTWTFTLNEGMTWVDYQGNYKADVVAEDWAYGLEFTLNYWKNEAANTSMPIEMIKGAGEYYEYTKALAEEEAMALGLEKFYEMVGCAVDGDYTITFTCLDKLSYFPTVTTYNCLFPISGKLLEEVGADGYFAITYDTLWYSGPYTITYYVQNNEKVLSKNEAYWNKDNVKLFNTVTYKMVDGVEVAIEMFKGGDLDYVELNESELKIMYEDAGNEFHDYLVEARPTKYSYQFHLVYDKNNEDGTSDVNWNTAIANENFRKSLYYGMDLTSWLARTNSINPLSCENYCYTNTGVATMSDGRDYCDVVMEKLGMTYDYTTYNRCDPEKAAEYKAAAIEELTAKGVTFPIEMDYYIAGSNQSAKDTADVLKQMFADCLGEDYVVLNICTYVSSLAQEVRNPRLASFYINGWGADFGDPVNFLGQETYGEDNAYYSQSYSNCNDATDPDLIATYQEFTRLVGEAKAITGDLDARYEAFAVAEAYGIEHALFIPCYVNITWELTGVNDFSKIYCAYGIMNNRFVNWETNDQLYTTEDYAAFKTAYANGEI